MDKKDKKPNVPNLRFEYDKQWKSGILDNLCQFYKGSGLSKNDLSNDGSDCILYGQLYTTYSNEVITNIISKTKTKLENPFYSKINDLIIPSSGEDPIDIAVARSVQVDNVILGGDLNVLRPNNEINSTFLSYQLNGKRKKDIAKIAQGKSIVHLHNNDLRKIKIYYPDIKEQYKISDLLFKIDKLITTQIKIIEAYQSLIKGICTKLITSKAGNTKIENCLYCNTSNLKESELDEINSGNYPVYGANGYIKSINNYQTDEDSIGIIKDGAGVGRMMKLKGKYSILATLNFLTARKGYNIDYIYYALKNKSFKKLIVGSGIPHIYFKDYKHDSIYIPDNNDEITAIVKILNTYDTIIINEKSLLLLLEQLKAYLLKNMFI